MQKGVGMRFKMLYGFLLMVLSVGAILSPTHVNAQNNVAELSANIKSIPPETATLTLKNISKSECQIATTAQGTVAITKVEQNGRVLQPQALDAAADEDIGYLLKSQLKTLKPGESATLPLLTYILPSGQILRATTWSSDGGVLSTQYTVDAKQPLKLELNYSLPITPEKGARACNPVFASAFKNPLSDRLSLQHILLYTAILIVFILIIVLVWLLFKRKHRAAKPTTTALLLLAFGFGAWLLAPSTYADITVPPDMQATFDGCMSTFNANRDITGPVLDVINNPDNHITIVRTSGGSDMTGYDHTFTIYWNPSDHHPYEGTGGNADPCTTLYHEMYHAFDMSNGTFSRNNCAGSGIETKEVMATRAQNVLRERLGMPARSHYGDRALPSGDCNGTPPPTCTGEHCAETNGDPHLRTFDGLRYDFQAVGEFIAARSTSGDFEVQVRQEPWADSRIVSLNTAVAFKVGNDRYEIRAGQALIPYLNGKQTALEASKLPGGGQVDLDQGIVVVTWPDGTKAFVRSVGIYGLALSMQPSDELAGKLEGLLGDANGNTNNDLRVRGSNTSIKPTHKELYPAYANSWRIADKTSLFTYPEGKNTGSYTDRSFPDESPDPKTLPGYAAAETLCKSFGISDPAILANCALDVAITGRSEFARAASNSQILAAGKNYGGTTWDLTLKNPGDTASVTFDAKAGDKIYVQVIKTNLPSQCGVLRLFGPGDEGVTDGCIINGGGGIDGKTLPTTGTYTIKLSPDQAGTATLRLLRIADKQGTITPDGAAVNTYIDMPGVIARYTFTGQVGQRVYVVASNSTLASQCGGLRLLNPDGSELTNGCIINKDGGIDTKTLPTNGQYTIILDPNDAVTGSVQLRLVLATAETKPITMDGPTLTTNLSKPGSIARFTFNGTAGQRIFVDLPSSELPSQCGILTLHAPDDGVTGSGCVINNKGNLSDDGTVLPVSGQYTIILDPNDAATGATTIRLRSH
jgi:hypothetical protein